MLNARRRRRTIEAFWKEFHRASPAILDACADWAAGRPVTGVDEILDPLSALLSPLGNLGVILGPRATGRPDLVISALGIRSLFPVVFEIVDAAPEQVRADWNVLALRPRVPDAGELAILYEGTPLRTADVAVQVAVRPIGVDLVVHLPGWDPDQPAESPANGEKAMGVFVLLDHLLGEWAVETQLGAIEFSAAPAPATAIPLAALPDLLDSLPA